MCGGAVENLSQAVKGSLTSEGIKRSLLSGGGDKLKNLDQGLRKDALAASRDAGVLPPKKVTVDPAAERAAAEAAATTAANARIAFQRRAQRENSLITGGGAAAPGAGRSTLGV